MNILKIKLMQLVDKIKKRLYGLDVNCGLADVFHIFKRGDIPERSVDWSIHHAGLDKFNYKGEGQKVAIIDTIVDIEHKDFQNRIKPINMLNSADGNKNIHGTFVASQILANGGLIGVAPMAEGISFSVIYGDERDEHVNFEKNLYDAILLASKNGCGVISMSIGFSYKSLLVEEAIDQVVSEGIIPIAACGNEGMIGSMNRSYPAAYYNCISVASANEKDMPSWFSSEGLKGLPEERPEIAVASQEYYWGAIPGNSYGYMLGTSMACPIVSGTALLWREAMLKKGMLPKGSDVLRGFRMWLRKVAKDTNKNGWDSSLGFGVLILEDGDLC